MLDTLVRVSSIFLSNKQTGGILELQHFIFNRIAQAPDTVLQSSAVPSWGLLIGFSSEFSRDE